MKNQVSNLDKLTLSNDFLFKHVMLRKRICKHILEELLHTKIADITYLVLKQNRHLMFIPTAMVFVWTSELLTTLIRITIWKCRSKILSAVLVNFNFPSALATTRPCWIQICCKRDRIMTSFLPLISSSSACLTSLRIPSVFILLKDAAWKTWRLN